MEKIYNIGALIVFGVKLQIYVLYNILRGGIILGIFPSFLFLYRVINSCFDEKMISHLDIKQEARLLGSGEKIKVNVIGYTYSILIYVFIINLQISRIFIQLPALRFVTFLLLISTISTGLHSLPILSKYELPLKQYFIQASLLSAISIFDTIAILVGMSLAFAIGMVIPIIGFFAGFPFIFVPYVWFSRASIVRLETMLYKGKSTTSQIVDIKRD